MGINGEEFAIAFLQDDFVHASRSNLRFKFLVERIVSV